MSDQEKIDLLLCPYTLLEIPTDIPSPVNPVLIRYPEIFHRNYASFIRQKVLSDSQKQGVPTSESIIKDAIEGGAWTLEEEDFLNKVDKIVFDLEEELKSEKFIVKQKRIKRKIEHYQNLKKDLNKKRDHFCIYTADYLAYEAYLNYLVRYSVLNIDLNYFWSSEHDFNNCKEKYPYFLTFLINYIANGNVWPIEDLRKIARSSEWRILWASSKENLDKLFNVSLCDLNHNQKLLVYWSRVYDYAYESYERPSEDIINNDQAFDLWLSDKSSGNKDKSKSSKTSHHTEQMKVIDGYHSEECTCGVKSIKVKGHGERPRHANSCPWGTWISYTQEEKNAIADQIYGNNPKEIQRILSKEQEVVANKGYLDERQLRDKRSRMVLGLNQKVNKLGRR